jgi:hypothetical protein
MLYSKIRGFSNISSRDLRCLRKIVKIGVFAISCLYVRKERVECYRRNCHVIWYLEIFRKYVEKNQIWLKPVMNKGYFTWIPTYIYNNTYVLLWGTRWRSWLRHCATSRKVTGSIPNGVTGRCVWLTTLPPSCADCHETWKLQTPGTLRASPGL